MGVHWVCSQSHRNLAKKMGDSSCGHLQSKTGIQLSSGAPPSNPKIHPAHLYCACTRLCLLLPRYRMDHYYAGFRPSPGWTPTVVPPSITRERFFLDYVSTRTPAIISGTVDPALQAGDWASLPDALVHVEKRDPLRKTYGTGVKVEMRLSKLFALIDRGEEGLYLTTQPLPDDASSGKPIALFGSPLSELAWQFPLRPRLAGNLAPSSVNLWLGASREGSSSNLHHDFHDNFYVLFRGRKRFTIAPPSDAVSLSPYGSIACIHGNGLINYGATVTRADGAPIDAVVDFLRTEVGRATSSSLRTQLRRELKAAQAAAHSMARERRPANPSGGDACDKSATAGGDERVLDSLSGDEDVACGGTTADDMWAALEKATQPSKKASGKGVARKKSEQAPVVASRVRRTSSAGEPRGAVADDVVVPRGGVQDVEGDSEADAPPSHFSRIDLPALRESLASVPGAPPLADARSFRSVQTAPGVAARWPSFARATLSTFDLLPGQSLFLPAGWFHEVVSYAEGPEAGSGGEAGGRTAAGPPPAAGRKRHRDSRAARLPVPQNCHVALNYWFHPPTERRFEQPYPDGFAEHLFKHASSTG